MRPISILFCVGMVFCGAAHAAEVAPLVPKMSPPKAAEIMLRFHDALAAGLKSGGLQVTAPKAVRTRLKLGVENAGCFEGPCLKSASSALGTDRLATLKLDAVGKNYTIQVRLYQGGTMTGKASGRCDICTMAEAVAAAQRTARDVGSTGEQPPPVGGTKPAAQPEQPPAQTAPTTPEQTTEQTTPTSQPTASGGRQWPLWPAIALAGVGVVGIAVGAPLIAIDGQGTNCEGPDQPNYANCRDLYKTAGGGWVMTTLGLAALAGSGVMFYLYYTSRPKQPRRAGVNAFAILPTADGGAVLGAGGRF